MSCQTWIKSVHQPMNRPLLSPLGRLRQRQGEVPQVVKLIRVGTVSKLWRA